MGAVLCAAGAVLPGCLKRTIAISSDPPGALVWLNDIEVGRTPLETDFTFYGTYDVRVHKDGYEPLVTTREARVPIYDFPPIDGVTEMIPGTHSVRLEWFFALAPSAEGQARAAGDQLAVEAAEADLIARGQVLRNQIGAAAPSSAPSESPKK